MKFITRRKFTKQKRENWNLQQKLEKVETWKAETWKLDFANRNLKIGIWKAETWKLDFQTETWKLELANITWFFAQKLKKWIIKNNTSKNTNRKLELKSWIAPTETWKICGLIVISTKQPATNSRYTRFGHLAEFKEGFVFGNFVFNRKTSHL